MLVTCEVVRGAYGPCIHKTSLDRSRHSLSDAKKSALISSMHGRTLEHYCTMYFWIASLVAVDQWPISDMNQIASIVA